jgi:hypothetical protein
MKRPLLGLSLIVPLLLAACATRDVTDISGGTIDPAGAGGDSGAAGDGLSGGQAGGSQAGSTQAGAAGQAGSAAGSGNAGGGQAGAAGQGNAGSGQAGAQPFGGGGGAAGAAAGAAQGGTSPFGGGGSPAAGGGTGGISGKGGSAGPGGGGPGGGGSPGGGGPGGAGAGGIAGGAGGAALCVYSGTGLDDPCYTCWNQAQTGSCAKEHDACAGNAECHALMVCWDTCKSDDQKCTKNCSADHPDGASAFQLLQSCLCGLACQTECSDQCSGLSTLNRCKHDVCTSGYDLDPDCSPCAKSICDEDPVCCDIGWDSSCASKAEASCGCPAPGSCLHSECATGAPLDAACSPCAQAVCAMYPLCCDAFGKWDLACANAVASLCSP